MFLKSPVAEEICCVLRMTDIDSKIEEDYSEEEFINAVKIYLQELRDQGCIIPKT